MARCHHESYGNILNELAGDVECAVCGLRGRYSHGRRKFGRPPRILWMPEDYCAAKAIQALARALRTNATGEGRESDG